MSNAVFPSLPGQTWPRVRTPRFSTVVHRAGARRFALGRQMYPTYLYRIPYGYLREADYDTLFGFFRARGGRLDDFLFDDRDDRQATAQTFAVADGTTTIYRLSRTLGGVAEPVGEVNAVTQVTVNGTPTLAYTVLGDARVQFTSAPTAGAVLGWTGTYYWRCAFTADSCEFEEFARRLRTTKAIEFESILR